MSISGAKLPRPLPAGRSGYRGTAGAASAATHKSNANRNLARLMLSSAPEPMVLSSWSPTSSRARERRGMTAARYNRRRPLVQRCRRRLLWSKPAACSPRPVRARRHRARFARRRTRPGGINFFARRNSLAASPKAYRQLVPTGGQPQPVLVDLGLGEGGDSPQGCLVRLFSGGSEIPSGANV